MGVIIGQRLNVTWKAANNKGGKKGVVLNGFDS